MKYLAYKRMCWSAWSLWNAHSCWLFEFLDSCANILTVATWDGDPTLALTKFPLAQIEFYKQMEMEMAINK